MSDMPPSVAEQLRFALLSDIRTVADALRNVSERIEAELASPSPNLEELQHSFLEIATTIQTRTRLHEKIGWPGEAISSVTLSFGDDDEKDLALEILHRYRDQLFVSLISGGVELNDKRRVLDGLSLLTDFLHVCRVDPQVPISVRRIGGHG